MNTRVLAVMLMAVGLLGGCSGSTAPIAEANPPAAPTAPTEVETPAPETVTETVAAPAPAPAPVAPVVTPPPALNLEPLVGIYVNDDYAKRGEGYDWVAIIIEQIDAQSAYVQARARGDRKRPTCGFDGAAVLTAEEVLEASYDGSSFLLTVNGDTLVVAPKTPDDENILYYFCSGGASLAGTYTRIHEALEASQLPPDAFSKVLSLQNVTFTVTANDSMPVATLVIRPDGLEIDSRLMVQSIDGLVTGAEVEDLNSDGWPELAVYVRSPSGYGTVIAYSVNDGKSMSAISFPDLEGEAAAGYRGRDEFTIIETSLARRFPIYKEGDADDKPTGGLRQIQYGLADGEASRVFSVLNVTDMDI
jgi:hypothetical protein